MNEIILNNNGLNTILGFMCIIISLIICFYLMLKNENSIFKIITFTLIIFVSIYLLEIQIFSQIINFILISSLIILFFGLNKKW